MRFVLSFIKVLKMSRLFGQDQDQDFFFKIKTKTKTIFYVLEAPRDQDQGLETTCLVLDESQMPNEKWQLLGDRTCLGMPDDTLPWAVQKWLNRLICRLGCGLGWAKGRTSSIVFTRWRQCALMGDTFVPVTKYD